MLDEVFKRSGGTHTTNEQIQQPAWSNPRDPRAILAAFLAGSWEDATTADTEIIANLADKVYPEVRRELHRLAKSSDPPIRTNDNFWYLVSKDDSWLLLRRHLSPDFLDRFEECCLGVLGRSDPALELPVGQRFMASAVGYGREHSDMLRRGLADTLAFLGTRCQQVDTVHAVEYSRISKIVRRLLKAASEDSTGRLWASIADVMPRLAESAPEEFLTAVHDGLQGESPQLKSLFGVSDGGNPLFNSYPYTGLMWALETLAWSSDHLSLATQCLARLAEIDPGGPLANRPVKSLKDIFLILNPQTSASLEQRLTVLNALLKYVPTIGWNLLLSLLPTVASVSHFTHRPKWRDWVTEVEPGVSTEEKARAQKGIASCILDFAGEDISRLVDVIGCMY